jgi:hypothetical protein
VGIDGAPNVDAESARRIRWHNEIRKLMLCSITTSSPFPATIAYPNRSLMSALGH